MSVTWNSSDFSADITLSGGDLVATRGAAADNWKSGRANTGRSSGKWYFEVKVNSLGGSDTYIVAGIAKTTMALTTQTGGAGSDSWGWQASAQKYFNGTNAAYGSAAVANDVIQVAVDMDAGKIWWGLNNSWFGSGDPAAGTNEAYSSISGTVYPAISLYHSGAEVLGEFLDADQTYDPPTGFTAWSPLYTEALSESGAIADTLSTLKITVDGVSSTGAIADTNAAIIETTPMGVSSTGDITLTASVIKVAEEDVLSTGAITDGFTANLIMYATLSEVAHIANFLADAGQLFEVWAITLDAGAEGRQYPAYLFSNFNFNGFATLNGKTYATGQGGIYRLGASDDNGTAIQSVLTTGKTNLGTDRDKRSVVAYLIGQFDTAMVVEANDGSGNSYEYQAERAASDARRQKVKMGRGMKGGLWAFAIKNRDGSNFDLNDLLIDSEPLSRRRS